VGAGALGVGGYTVHQLRERGYILRTPDGAPRPLADHRVTLPAHLPKMVLVRGKDAAKNVFAGLAAFGGMGTFVKRGDVVVVKPNIGFDLSEHYAVTTNPAVVAAVVRACLSAGAKEVIVTDGPVKNVAAAFAKSGIQAAAEGAGAKVVTPAEAQYVNTHLPGFGAWQVLEPYMRATKVINVPIVKHHGLAGATIGMKGWFGAIGGLRFKLHKRIDDAVAGLAEMMRPTLTVVDASRALMRNGPMGGNLDDVKGFDTVCVTPDPVAGDAWGSALIRAKRSKLGWLDLGEARGLGTADYASLRPLSVNV
jgi:uncharacterized protein (DUF362 family)